MVWQRAVALQASRLTATPNQPLSTLDVQPDVLMMMVALRDFVRAAELVKALAQDAEVTDAVDKFVATIPGLKQARDVLEHFDDYLVGRGRNSEVKKFRPRISSDGEASRLHVEPYVVNLTAADQAAAELMPKLVLHLAPKFQSRDAGS